MSGDLVRRNFVLTLVIVAVGIGLGASLAGQSRPRVQLNPRLAHIWLYMPDHWDIRLFENPDMSGVPTIHLTDEGLFVSGKLRCSWPGGRYDGKAEANMILGYKSLEAVALGKYDGCGPPLPVLSTWGDGGTGTAVIFIEVARRKGSIVEAPYGSRTVFLDLNSLPGDPQQPVPGLRNHSRGFIGWEWMPSGRSK